MSRKKTEGKQQQSRPKPRTPEARKAAWDMFDKLRVKANQGDQKARADLFQFLKHNDWLWQRFGDAAAHAQRSIVEAMAGAEWLTFQCIQHEAGRMRKRLLGASPTLLEEVAAERIVAAWLQLQHAEMRCAEPHRDLGWSKFWVKRLELANKMYDSAVQSLALIRQFLPAPAPEVIELEPVSPTRLVDHQPAKSRIGSTISPGGSLEQARSRANGHGVNRIAALMDSEGIDGNECDDSPSGKHDGVNRIRAVLKKAGRNGVAIASG